MNILKRNITQMVLVGLLFAIIASVVSFAAFDLIKKTELQKQISIIDADEEALRNDLQILNISKNENYSGYKSLNAEFHASLNYTILRYQRNPMLAGGCHTIQYALTDNSIFIETNDYPVIKSDEMDQCLDNILELSFKRLVEKVMRNNNEALLRIKSQNAEYSQIQNLKAKNQLSDKICNQMDSIYTNLAKGMDVYDNLRSLNILIENCNSEKITGSNVLEIKIKKMQESVQFLKNASFDDIFKIERIYMEIENDTTYLSKKSTIFTFAILGFIFGVLLIYNFRVFK